MTRSTRWDEDLADLDHYLQPAVFFGDGERGQRAALQLCFGCVYRMRTAREVELGTSTYRAHAVGSSDGETTEALIMVRGAYDHNPDAVVAPSDQILYPSARTFPGRWTFPGSNPTWRPLHQIRAMLDAPQILLDAYDRHLPGMIAGYAFDAARRFLVDELED